MRLAPALLLIAALHLAACSDTAQQSNSTQTLTADTVYTNAIVWSGEKGAADATTIAIKDGLIVYVGDGTDVRVTADNTIDLDGQFVMPGFVDNHVHILDGGGALAGVDLRDAATPTEFSRRITEYAAGLPAGQWVLNGNWDHELWGGELPRKDWLDETTANTPVFVNRLDGHMALANSAALKLAGIDASSVSPAAGEIVRDANGAPTGVLKDSAMSLVLAAIPEPSAEQLLTTIDLAQQHALSLGLTQMHAVTAHPDDRMFDALQLAHDRGLLKMRIYAHTPLPHWQQARNRVASAGAGDKRLRWDSLKGMVDGSLGSTTAWFHEPYTDVPQKSGFALLEPEKLRFLIAQADAAGLKLAVHAIGDQAIDELIAAMHATAGDDIRSRRYRIEHFQHPSREAINLLAQYGIIASMQPYHAIDDGRWAEKRIGPQRIKTTYAFRSILDAGGILTFGSDWPVAPLSPLLGVYAAVTRRTIDGANPDGWQAQEKISVEEALTAYTAANAYAAFEDDVTGTLRAGKRADIVVLSDDPRRVASTAIAEIEVVATIIDGETVYSR